MPKNNDVQNKDVQRIQFNQQALTAHKFDALICALPAHVRMLSGYEPVVGNSIVIATAQGVTLVVPDDEKELAAKGWADDIRTFKSGSLDRLTSLADVVQLALIDALRSHRLEHGLIGFEHGPFFQPAPYVSMCFYGALLTDMLHHALPAASFEPADDLIKSLQLIKTATEIDHIRRACKIASAAFIAGKEHIHPGRTETFIASQFQSHMLQSRENERAAGYAFCMSGPNAANAFKAYQRSSGREVKRGDLILVHCNSTAGGFWTDITRTYALGKPDDHQRQMYTAVLAARAAAIAAVRPGARAADIDHAARNVLREAGFAKEFKHPTGHGVGFGAINHRGQPRIHPLSQDILKVGMVFNIEPAIYFDNQCGMRQCEMLAVTPAGAELLTPFHNEIEQLVIE